MIIRIPILRHKLLIYYCRYFRKFGFTQAEDYTGRYITLSLYYIDISWAY